MSEELISGAIDGLAEKRWAVCPGFLSEAETRAILEDASARKERGEFSPAGIGRGGSRLERREIRGDETRWWEDTDLTPAQHVLYEKLSAYRDALNRELYLGLRRVELHYAFYPPGTFYKRHVDTFVDSRRRLVSCVLYLNAQWRPEDGGELVLYPERQDPVSILPRTGLLATFLSEDLPHEVLPNVRGRWSVTGWMGKDGI